MACPFSHQSGGITSPVATGRCPFSGSIYIPAQTQQQQQQQCPAPSGQLAADVLLGSLGPLASIADPELQLPQSSQAFSLKGMLTPSSSSDSLTEHQDLAEFEDHAPYISSSSSAAANAAHNHGMAATSLYSSSSSSIFSGNSNGASSSSSSTTVHQAWQLKRPMLHHDPKLTRRQLRQLGRSWTLEDVAAHKYCDDGWIAVDGKVYDITEHLVNHPGWDSGCQVTTVLSIIAHLGSDCSEEFREIHRPYPVAWKQLQAFYIGDLLSQ